jgi:hypothetical protein
MRTWYRSHVVSRTLDFLDITNYRPMTPNIIFSYVYHFIFTSIDFWGAAPNETRNVETNHRRLNLSSNFSNHSNLFHVRLSAIDIVMTSSSNKGALHADENTQSAMVRTTITWYSYNRRLS